MEDKKLIGIFLPEGILDYFKVIWVEKTLGSYIIDLEEQNIHPEKYKEAKLSSKGFYDPITIQDFPLRGKACFLRVKRRRWLNEDTGKVVVRDWDLVAKGTRMTSEFAAFLKAINR